jgi:hypothetical protein
MSTIDEAPYTEAEMLRASPSTAAIPLVTAMTHLELAHVVHRRSAVCYPLVHDAPPVWAVDAVATIEDFAYQLVRAARRVPRWRRRRITAMGHAGEPIWPQLSMSMFERPRKRRASWRAPMSRREWKLVDAAGGVV